MVSTEEPPGAARKRRQARTLPKLHFKYAAKLNDLRLTDEDIDALVEKKLHEFEAHLQKHHFPEFDLFPADAQLGILSMSWACGPGFPATFKNFKRAALARDWVAAKATCDIRTESNPGVVPRNTNNRRCFLNAATVHDRGLDPSILYWPNEAPLDGPIAPPLSDSDRARIEALRAEHVHDLFEMNQRDKHDTEPPDTEPDPSPPESAA